MVVLPLTGPPLLIPVTVTGALPEPGPAVPVRVQVVEAPTARLVSAQDTVPAGDEPERSVTGADPLLVTGTVTVIGDPGPLVPFGVPPSLDAHVAV